MICAGRKARPASARNHGRKVGNAGRTSADGRCLPTQRGVCAVGARSRWEAQSPAAQPHQEAVRSQNNSSKRLTE